jgi:hypothetical protein
MRVDFVHAGMKAQETKVAKEQCWATTQAAGRPCCGQSGSGMYGVLCFSSAPLYMHV